ncbi:hypothetical protein [Alterisphingorhabdus coralli]|uniref:Peptidase C-terminal archaeal/bacterial domain-containing protein n=1 Tax=Alterisphingorhabdus coralli TaxID=3071408 RepID=A0AA97F617_9SPHN|nr:hypothetical protein [Parasphingorhabdus sp. SCSIO 66989]WOE73767.1 hypothetical protein RB602_07770 [Parasphingorhabdus sp. SCSIO 66989]
MTSHRHLCTVLTLALAATGLSPLAAQPEPQLDVERAESPQRPTPMAPPVRERVDTGDSSMRPVQGPVRNLDGAPADVRVYRGTLQSERERFAVRLNAGEAVRITVSAEPGTRMDPVLKVYDRDTNRLLKQDDDSGEGLAAEVHIYSEQGQNLLLLVSAASSYSGKPAFEVALRPSRYRPQPPRNIGNGGSFTGEVLSKEGHEFRFIAERGDRWVFSLMAPRNSSLDPIAAIYRGTAVSGDPLAQDDDSGEGRNALLEFIAPSSGTYTLLAKGHSSSNGAYRLDANKQGREALPKPVLLNFGDAVQGRLVSANMPVVYRLSDATINELRRNPGRITITMNKASSDSSIDPKLELGFDYGTGFAVIEADDDGGEGVNSRIETDLSGLAEDPEMLNRLRIKAGAVGGDGGSYILTLTRPR